MKRWKICLDLDDTLIPNVHRYHNQIWRCGLIISRAMGFKSSHPLEVLKLHNEIDIEMVKSYGFGTLRFPESWIRVYETLAEKAGVPVDPMVAQRLFATARRFAYGPFRPFPGVKGVLRALRRQGHELHLITAGEERLQQRKIDQAGLEPLFDSTSIVEREKEAVMASIVGDDPGGGVMVGDSMRSDILPAVKIGMVAVWIPCQTWSFNNVDVDSSSYHRIASVGELPKFIHSLGNGGRPRNDEKKE